MKADGFPTYHLANVVDDHEMGITHVVRGEEWISSTPKHVLLYDWLGWERPAFAHMPLLRNTDKSKISKRKNPAARLTWFLEQGYLPEALRNFLALMGYSQPDGEEIFTFDDMVRDFDWARVNAVGPVFDLDKLNWLNGHYVRELSVEDLAGRITDHLVRRGRLPAEPTAEQRALVLAATPLVNERMQVLSEAEGMLGFLLVDDADFAVDPDDAAKVLTAEARPVLDATVTALGDLATWATADIEAALRSALVEGLGPQAEAGVRSGAGRGHRPTGVAAAVRVARAARPRALPGPAEGRARGSRGMTLAAGAADGAQLAGDPHPRLLRTPRSAWWRPVLGLVLAGGDRGLLGRRHHRAWRCSSPRATGGSADTEDALDPDTALGLLANNLVIATMIPAARARGPRRAPGTRRLAGVGDGSGAVAAARPAAGAGCRRGRCLLRPRLPAADVGHRDGRLGPGGRHAGRAARCDPAHDAAAGGRRGGRLPRLPHPGGVVVVRPARRRHRRGRRRQRDLLRAGARRPGPLAVRRPVRVRASSRPGWPGAPAGWRHRSRCTS